MRIPNMVPVSRNVWLSKMSPPQPAVSLGFAPVSTNLEIQIISVGVDLWIERTAQWMASRCTCHDILAQNGFRHGTQENSFVKSLKNDRADSSREVQLVFSFEASMPMMLHVTRSRRIALPVLVWN